MGTLSEPAWALPIYAPEYDGKKFRVDPTNSGAWSTVTITSTNDAPRYNFKALDTALSFGEYIASLIEPILDASHGGSTTVATSYQGGGLQGAIAWAGTGHPTSWAIDFGTTVLLASEVIDAFNLLGFSKTGGPGANGIYVSSAPASPTVVGDYQSGRVWIAREPTTRDHSWSQSVNSVGEPLIEKQNTVLDPWAINTFREVEVEQVEAAIIHRDQSLDADYVARVTAEYGDPLLSGDPNVTLGRWHSLLSALGDPDTDLVPVVYHLFDWPTTFGTSPSTEREQWVITNEQRLLMLDEWITEISFAPLLYNVRFEGWRVGGA